MPHPHPTVSRLLRLGSVLLLVLILAPTLEAQTDGKMVALVNGAIIYRDALDQALLRHLYPMGAPEGQALPPDAQGAAAALLENLIDRELLIQEARRRGLSVSVARVLRRLERLPEALRPKAPPETATAGGAAEEGAAGGDDSLFRFVQEGMLIERLLEEELPQIGAVSERRARAYYDANAAQFVHPEEVHLRHILVRVPAEATVEVRQQAYLQAQAVAQRLAEGEDFTVLAIDRSQCPSSAQGGDLGYLTRDQLYPTLAQAAFDLPPGQPSRIVESPAGYHLLLVSDRRPARQLSFLLVREGLQKRLRADRLQKAARQFIRQLRSKATIERLLD